MKKDSKRHTEKKLMRKPILRSKRGITLGVLQSCSVSQRKEVKITLPSGPWEKKEDRI